MDLDPSIRPPILLICHGFPPVRGIGGRRWAKFAKELARRGYTVHVIRSAGSKGRLDSLWTKDGASPDIIHHPIPPNYPVVLHKRPITSFTDKVMYRVWSKLLPLLVKGNIHDSTVFSRSIVLAKAKSLIQAHGIRNVIVSGAPFRLMAFATELTKDFPQINLVSDFRDVWTWGTDYGLGTMAPKRLQHEKELEALVVKTSNKIIAPSALILEHLQETYAGDPQRYVIIPHAVDPDDLAGSPAPARDGVFRMIYAGSLYGAEEARQYFNTLLDAFEACRRDRPEAYAHCRLDLYITGHDTAAYQVLVQARDMQDRIHFHAPVPPKEIFKRVAHSDLVLTFIPRMNKDLLGTKFNEIFHLRKPVLHVGKPGLVSRTITARKLGASLRVEDLITELPRIISGERKIEVDENADHSALLLANITDRLIAEVLV